MTSELKALTTALRLPENTELSEFLVEDTISLRKENRYRERVLGFLMCTERLLKQLRPVWIGPDQCCFNVIEMPPNMLPDSYIGPRQACLLPPS